MSNFKNMIAALGMLSAAAGQAQTCRPESIPATAPASRFTVHGDGTATDQGTGLMWKRCAEGQTGADCSGGAATPYTWQGALERARSVNRSGGFAGYSDWRLPNLKELGSIVERQCFDPAVDLSVFPSTPSSWFWSSSPVANHGSNAWIVLFSSGNDGWFLKGSGDYVRLVRGGQ